MKEALGDHVPGAKLAQCLAHRNVTQSISYGVKNMDSKIDLMNTKCEVGQDIQHL